MLIWTGACSGRNRLGRYLCHHDLVQKTWKLVLGFIQDLERFGLPTEHSVLNAFASVKGKKELPMWKWGTIKYLYFDSCYIFFTLPFGYFAYITVVFLLTVLMWHLIHLLGSTSVQWVAFYEIIFYHQFLSYKTSSLNNIQLKKKIKELCMLYSRKLGNYRTITESWKNIPYCRNHSMLSGFESN